MLIIIYAFFFTSHTKSKKKKSVHKTCGLQCTSASLSTISTAIWVCVCTYIFLYHHIHCHFAVANSFREISVASPNKHVACITPNNESLVLSLRCNLFCKTNTSASLLKINCNHHLLPFLNSAILQCS